MQGFPFVESWSFEIPVPFRRVQNSEIRFFSHSPLNSGNLKWGTLRVLSLLFVAIASRVVLFARDVEVVVVLFNLFQGGAMAVFLDFGTIPVGLDNFLDMFRTELILRFNLFEFA